MLVYSTKYSFYPAICAIPHGLLIRQWKHCYKNHGVRLQRLICQVGKGKCLLDTNKVLLRTHMVCYFCYFVFSPISILKSSCCLWDKENLFDHRENHQDLGLKCSAWIRFWMQLKDLLKIWRVPHPRACSVNWLIWD